MTKENRFNLEFFKPSKPTANTEIPMSGSGVHAGFPSPADDFIEKRLDVNKIVIKHPDATFFARVEGDSMKDEHIEDGDILVVDKAEEPVNGSLVVAFIDGEFTLKRLNMENGRILLVPANDNYQPIEVTPDNEFIVWGVVRWVLKDTTKHVRSRGL